MEEVRSTKGMAEYAADEVDVSVIVPVYNAGAYLDQCLASILQNDRVRLEVIVVNDGSTDGSLDTMTALSLRDPRVRVLDRMNSGYGASVNAGFAVARGTYLAIVESDDYVLPHFYDDVFDFARSFDGLPQVVKTPYLRIVGADTDQEVRLKCKMWGWVKPKEQPFRLTDAPMLVHFHPCVWSALYLRSFIEGENIRLVEAPAGGWVDNPFLWETLCRAESIAYLERAYYCYREDLPGSSSVGVKAQLVIDRWNDMQDIVEKLGVTDEALLNSHLWHGFTFLEQALGSPLSLENEYADQIRAMLGRMDARRVLGDPYISGASKEFFCKVRGIEGATWDDRAHRAFQLSDALHGLRANGLDFVKVYARVLLRRK